MATDPEFFKAPYIARTDIWKQADEFRAEHAGGGVPVDIGGIVEFSLGLEIRPVAGLKRDCDAEAALLGDLRTIIVDTDSYMLPKYENRFRFSLAHEIGHLVLHRDVIRGVAHRTVAEWVEYYRLIPDREYRFLEFHANEFAGRLLVPPDELADEVTKWVAKAATARIPVEAGGPYREYLASAVAKRFGVSAEVVDRRLQSEESIWPPR